MSLTTSSLSLSATSTSVGLATSSPLPTCDVNIVKEVIDPTLQAQGPICAFPFAIHLNFTQCCAPHQSIHYTDQCTQYCVIQKNETVDEFADCVKIVAKNQNITVGPGIWGCQPQSGSGRVEVRTWKVSMLCLVLVGFAAFA